MKVVLAAIGIAAAGAVDVQHYGLDLRVDPLSNSLRGVVEVRAQLLSSAPTEVALDLSRALAVETIALNGKPAEFRRNDDQILIAVKQPPPQGESLSIAVTYQGTPQGNGFTFTERNGQPAISP